MNNYEIEGFEKNPGMNLVYHSEDREIQLSFEYGKLKITSTVPEAEAVVKDGKVTTEALFTRNQIKDIIDIYARLYEPRIVGWSN